MLLACASAVFGGKDPAVKKASGAVPDPAASSDDPLERLRQRSARKRWEQEAQAATAPPSTKLKVAPKPVVRTPLELGNDDEAETQGLAEPEPVAAPAVPEEPPALKPATPRALRTPPRRNSRTAAAPKATVPGWREIPENEDKTDIPSPAEIGEEEDAAAINAEATPEKPKRTANRKRSRSVAAPKTVRTPSQPAAEKEIAISPEERAAASEDVEFLPNPASKSVPRTSAKSAIISRLKPIEKPIETEEPSGVDLIEPPPPRHASELLSRTLGFDHRATPASLASRSRVITVAQAKTNIPAEPIRDPRQLPKISTIKPFADYEPDPERLKDDKCHNLCPRPKFGCPDCKKGEDGTVQCPDCPDEVRLSQEHLAPRNFAGLTYCWTPTDLWNYPLYFEDPDLERYGHTRGCLQPLWSVGRFGVQLFGLPYQMTIDPICKKRYALGYYRPGACVPYKYTQAPWNTEAALVEAGVLTGSFYLFAP